MTRANLQILNLFLYIPLLIFCSIFLLNMACFGQLESCLVRIIIQFKLLEVVFIAMVCLPNHSKFLFHYYYSYNSPMEYIIILPVPFLPRMQGQISFYLNPPIYLLLIFEFFSDFIDFGESVNSKIHHHHFR